MYTRQAVIGTKNKSRPNDVTGSAWRQEDEEQSTQRWKQINKLILKCDTV